MNVFWKEFFHRGFLAAWGGPVILAMIYGISAKTGTMTSVMPGEVCLGILTLTLLAFVVAGLSAVYQIDRLPLGCAILIHGAGLYVVYLAVYLINGWLKDQLVPIAVFSVIFAVCYAVIWLIIYLSVRAKTKKLNGQLQTQK
ncbi:MAG: DUF3021 domain-containing protein [Oscillospiraceae bacterium]|nr:DUF3021 domain-containing protein [Oscillospiraceae bacterium]